MEQEVLVGTVVTEGVKSKLLAEKESEYVGTVWRRRSPYKKDGKAKPANAFLVTRVGEEHIFDRVWLEGKKEGKKTVDALMFRTLKSSYECLGDEKTWNKTETKEEEIELPGPQEEMKLAAQEEPELPFDPDRETKRTLNYLVSNGFMTKKGAATLASQDEDQFVFRAQIMRIAFHCLPLEVSRLLKSSCLMSLVRKIYQLDREVQLSLPRHAVRMLVASGIVREVQHLDSEDPLSLLTDSEPERVSVLIDHSLHSYLYILSTQIYVY